MDKFLILAATNEGGDESGTSKCNLWIPRRFTSFIRRWCRWHTWFHARDDDNRSSHILFLARTNCCWRRTTKVNDICIVLRNLDKRDCLTSTRVCIARINCFDIGVRTLGSTPKSLVISRTKFKFKVPFVRSFYHHCCDKDSSISFKIWLLLYDVV